MRPPLLKTTLAILRTTIGLGQRDMAKLLGCSMATVQSIEMSRLALSKKLAHQTSLQTGVDPDWLLRNEYKEPPVSNHLPPRQYTKEVFEERQADLAGPRYHPGEMDLMRKVLTLGFLRLSTTLLQAYRTDNITRFFYKFRIILQELEHEFGKSGDLENALKPNRQEALFSPEPKLGIVIQELNTLLEQARLSKQTPEALSNLPQTRNQSDTG